MKPQKLQDRKQGESFPADAIAPGIAQGPFEDRRPRAEAILLASPLPIVALDAEGAVQSWNPAAEQMFGWSLEEVLGTPIPVVPQEEEVRYRQTREMLLQGRAQTGVSVSPRKRDGSRFPALLATAPLFDEAGRMNGSLHIFQALKEREPDGGMIEDLRMEAIGRLARTISHEFNNSIGAILGWAEVALEGLDPHSPLRKPLDHILKEARHASKVTQDLASFSQRQSLEMYEVDLNHVAERALDLLANVHPPAVVVEKALTPNLPRILADPGQIARVLLDLCLFAREGMPEGGSLQVETGQTRVDADTCRKLAGATPGHYALLCISHGGARLDTDTLRRLFEPFSAAPRDGMGSGLGLAVAYGIVRQHGGFIHASSGPDHGTRLQVYLPVLATDADSAR